MKPAPIVHNALSSDAISHGFFTRAGGGSKGIYAGLNCGYGSDDEAAVVMTNRTHVANTLPVVTDALITVHQHHSADVIVAKQPWHPKVAPKGDAMVTATPGLALGILTADCAPVLFADPEAGVIGAAHAGWRGALSGVLEATVQAMANLGAKRGNIAAVVGPCIAQASYEVGAEYQATFVAENTDYDRFFIASPKARHFQFDLAGFVMARLHGLGLRQSHDLGMDTYADDELFFSYRRTCHRDEPDYGRQISAIALTDKG
ncbi:MAG: peptidoglycan editing factor PgeF [Alphaproteobacteria bacterium]|jgi:YfiH family protein|nr:peptidoglycan editing factor PgeF [Alphaproteobacteria bacterium]